MPRSDRTSSLTRALRALVLFSAHHAWGVVLASAVLAGAALYYTVHHLSINTDTDEMINPALEFRQTYGKFNAQFPQLADNFVVVVEAPTPEAAEAGASRLADRLAQDTAHFHEVFAPGVGPFFETNGFLFLGTERLSGLTNRLAEAQPLIAPLAEDPSLAALFRLIASVLALARDNEVSPTGLEATLSRMARVVNGRSAGEESVLSWQTLLDPDSGSETTFRRYVLVKPVLDFTRLQPAKAALGEARLVAEALAGEVPGTHFGFTGKVALNAEELEVVSEGALQAGLLSFVLVALILIFGVRAPRVVAAALVTLALGLLWTTAFALFAVGQLNIVSVAFAALFIGLGIDFAIHFGLRCREELQEAGTLEDALAETARTAGAALALGAPATAIGFFAFAPTDYQGLAQLGLISGTGIFIAFFASLTVMPALLIVMGLAPDGRAGSPAASRGAAFLAGQARTVCLIALALALAGLFTLPAVGFDFDPIRLKASESPSVQTYLTLAAEKSATPYSLQVTAPDERAAAALKERLLALPEVERVVSVASFIPTDQEEKRAILDDASIFLGSLVAAPIGVQTADPQAERLAFDTLRQELQTTAATAGPPLAEAARALDDALSRYRDATGLSEDALEGLREALVLFLPATLSRLQLGLLPDEVGLESLPEDLRARYVAADGTLRLEVIPSGNPSNQKVLRQTVKAVSAVAPAATGSAVQIVNAGAVVERAMIEATLIAIGAIGLFVALILRRLSDALLVILPVALATLLTTAATAWVQVPFNFANIIVLPLVLGLGVTSGIHIVLRARREDRGADLFETSTPRAVLLSALTTLASFASLSLSAHDGTASMGILLSIGLGCTLVSTLIFLPALLTLMPRR